MSHRDEPSDPFHAHSEVMYRRLSHANLGIPDHIVRCPTRKHGASCCNCTAAYCIIVLRYMTRQHGITFHKIFTDVRTYELMNIVLIQNCYLKDISQPVYYVMCQIQHCPALLFASVYTDRFI